MHEKFSRENSWKMFKGCFGKTGAFLSKIETRAQILKFNFFVNPFSDISNHKYAIC
jgi:hypothetical protein